MVAVADRKPECPPLGAQEAFIWTMKILAFPVSSLKQPADGGDSVGRERF